MDETELILRAIAKSAPIKPKKRIMHEIDPDPTVFGKDAIWALAEKMKKKPKRSVPLNRWSNIEFARYLDSILKVHGLHLERLSPKESDAVAGIHDKLVLILNDKMNPQVLKDYFDWWVSCYAQSMHGRKIYVASLSQDYMITRFTERYNADTRKPQTEIKKNENVSDEQIYKLGGLSMLLMSRGVVNSYKLLKNDSNTIVRISETMRKLSKEVVTEIVDTTINLGPYSESDKVDFLSISKPSLDYHGVKKFQSLNYQRYFE